MHGAATPNTMVNLFGIPVSQPKPIQLQSSAKPINANTGPAIFTGTSSIVQITSGEGVPTRPVVQRSPQDFEEAKTKLEFLEEAYNY